MKIKLSVLCLFIAAGALITSCSDDNDGGKTNNKDRVILSKYPNATKISWAQSKDKKYNIATFCLPKVTKAAAVDTVTVWLGQNEAMRLIEQEISFTLLPVAVQDKFNTTKSIHNTQLYGNAEFWEIDDVYKLERDGIVSYKIEADGVKEEVEMDIYFDAQGIILKEVKDADENDDDEAPLEIPANIKSWITKNHPNAEVLDYELEQEGAVKEYELDLKEGNIILEITITENGANLTVETEYNYPNPDALPKDVLAKLKAAIATQQAYKITDIDDIEMVQKGKDQIFTFEFETKSSECELEITKKSDGTFVVGEFSVED